MLGGVALSVTSRVEVVSSVIVLCTLVFEFSMTWQPYSTVVVVVFEIGVVIDSTEEQ